MISYMFQSVDGQYSLVANHDQSLKINPQFLIPHVTKEILVYVIHNSIAIDFQFERAKTRHDSTSKKRILFIFILRQSKVIIISLHYHMLWINKNTTLRKRINKHKY